jgi:hypothetical protein
MENFKPYLIAKAIKLPVKEWPGNCFYVATQCVLKKVIKGTPRYGHWLGPVDSKSMFAKNKAVGFARHGWVEVGARIFDPTRWVFENVKPYIYFGKNDFYDIGGNAFRIATRSDPPAFSPTENQVVLGVPLKVHAFIKRLLADPFQNRIEYSKGQIFWLANCSPDELHPYAKEIYRALIKSNCGACIPYDNRLLILEGE